MLSVQIPPAVGMIWTDNVLIPKGGDAYTASVYMNYVYIPAVAKWPPDPVRDASRRGRSKFSKDRSRDGE